jgi:hypothetical protein
LRQRFGDVGKKIRRLPLLLLDREDERGFRRGCIPRQRFFDSSAALQRQRQGLEIGYIDIWELAFITTTNLWELGFITTTNLWELAFITTTTTNLLARLELGLIRLEVSYM